MVINKVKLLNEKDAVSILIRGTKISSIDRLQNRDDPFQLGFDNAIAFPGLINSHDHLDFNLFPKLGNKIYNNYTQWGTSIHINYKKQIDEVLKVPEPLRISWGIYKNLLCGVTTVVNHGKYLSIPNPLITVLQSCQNLHSLGFERFWKLKLNNPFKRNICVMHAGEGTDKLSEEEIDELIKWNLLKRKLIAVHGVAMNEKQASKFKALIWCPASNYFLLNKTAVVNKLKNHTKICFGTDSTLTSDWNIWNHIRLARQNNLLTDKEILNSFTTTPANLWGLDCGSIAAGKDADIIIAKAAKNSFDAFYCIDPEQILMIIKNGNILLFDESILHQFDPNSFELENFSKIKIKDNFKFVKGDLAGLIGKIKGYSKQVQLPKYISSQ